MVRDLSTYTEEGRRSEVSNRRQSLSKMLQSTSEMSKYPGARPGDIVLGVGPYQDVVVPRDKGAVLIFLTGSEVVVEWPPGPFSSTGPVDEHLIRPPDAEKIPNSFNWIRRSNGNRLENTFKVYALTQVGEEWPHVLFYFQKTALKSIEAALSAAERVRVKIGDDEALVIGATWKMTTEQVKGDSGPYFRPIFEMLARAGEPGGPSKELLARAWDLRRELKLDEDELREETVKLFAAQKAALIEHKPVQTPPLGREPGRATYTTGLADLASRRPDLAPSPPPDSKDPSDSLDDLPFA